MSISQLPNDILSSIYRYLDIPDLDALYKTSHAVQNTIDIHSEELVNAADFQLVKEHFECIRCFKISYAVDVICPDCRVCMCDNCFTVRTSGQSIHDIVINSYGIKRCRNLCEFICWYCYYQTEDTREMIFYANPNRYQCICHDCYQQLLEDEKNKWKVIEYDIEDIVISI